MATTKIKRSFDISDHGTTINAEVQGLKLAGTLVVPTAAQLNAAVDDSTRIVSATASTLTVTQATHANKIVNLNRAAGVAVTLPAASGSGSLYRFFLGTAVTSNSTTIKVANASDIMAGVAIVQGAAANAGTTFKAGASDDTITLNGTTTGGLKGDFIEVIDVATNMFLVRVVSQASGTLATPFSATV